MSRRPLGKSYEPQVFEAEIYKFWQDHHCFDAADKSAPGQKAFCIVIPPPNVTGALHMGHALTNTIQDILTRWRRMHGDNALWLPGTDHAGIATQAQVEKAVAKEGKGPSGRPLTRHDLGRVKFLERTWKWKEEHGSQITNQLKRLGSSLDWKRERFTMDDGFSAAVREVFVRLYNEKLIYRGERIINWCPRCMTALSDLEVIPTDRKGFLWHIAYPVVGSKETLTIATTRPETLLGDSAVAVHPEDERYKHLHGKKVLLPLLKRELPIIVDEYVDREFGTGALKITPAHDFNDYDLGKKHNLPSVTVIGKDGKITAAGGPYAGLKVSEARERVVQDLKDAGQLLKTEDHMLKVGLCQRCESVAEPLISKQWFVKIAPLAKPAIEAVETGKITFTPKNWEKTYFEWMRNIRDWCISRQLWWGHQIPAWYCGNCQEITVALTTPKNCDHCKAAASELKQDEDVLDTWSSSALWPFGTLGWPNQTDALKTFYPTAILETGFDIIFFWVARMIMMGIHFMGDVPFHKIYLHAMVRDEKGEKMSKSKGNVIDPLVLIDQHGSDSLRFTLAIMAGQGRDVKLSVDRVEGYRAFNNKLWNAVKFFHLQFEEAGGGPIKEPAKGAEGWLLDNRVELDPVNRWILSKLQALTEKVEASLKNFELNEGAQALYDFTWGEFCDWYIEFCKVKFKESPEAREATLITYHYVMERVLRLMHPFCPFVTEELWQSLPWKAAGTTTARQNAGLKPFESLMVQKFPESVKTFKDEQAEHTIDALKSVVEAIRNFRGENRISPKKPFTVRYHPQTSAAHSFVQVHAPEIVALTQISGMERFSETEEKNKKVDKGNQAVIPLKNPPLDLCVLLDGLVDIEEERSRLRKEIEKITEDVAHVRGKLTKPSFIDKAPVELVNKEKAREQEMLSKLGDLETALQKLTGK